MTDDELREIHEAIELATAESRRAYSFSGGSSYAYASMVACLRAHRVITALRVHHRGPGAAKFPQRGHDRYHRHQPEAEQGPRTQWTSTAL